MHDIDWVVSPNGLGSMYRYECSDFVHIHISCAVAILHLSIGSGGKNSPRVHENAQVHLSSNEEHMSAMRHGNVRHPLVSISHNHGTNSIDYPTAMLPMPASCAWWGASSCIHHHAAPSRTVLTTGSSWSNDLNVLEELRLGRRTGSCSSRPMCR